MYYETFRYVGQAIRREKQLKGWLRAKKFELIESTNCYWKDLAADWYPDLSAGEGTHSIPADLESPR